MCKSRLMQESQSFGRGREHFLNFLRRERALGKNLRQILFRVFHHDVEEIAGARFGRVRFQIAESGEDETALRCQPQRDS